MKTTVIAIVAVLVLGGIWVVGARNGLVTREEKVRAAWSQVENSYQRRMDLVPNLVETVKGAAGFEKETYTAVAEARANAGKVQITPELLDNPEAFAQFEKAQGQLTQSLSRLLVSVERYPELRATANFKDLQAQLEGTENRISVERKRFNDAVGEYNTTVRRFPANIAASLFGFSQKPYFQAAEGANKAPAVKF
jgi:LemA protein